MKISTRGRYAIRVMLDLAEQNAGEYIPLIDIARRQGISEKYLEAIAAMLVKNELLIALRGKGGGYRLARSPESYSVASILRVTEGSFAPVACLEQKQNPCERAGYCKTLGMWKGLQKLIEDYFENITIQDLLDDDSGIDHYVI
ncbi:MAG: RrF2 family transcriptional regulator [Kineothrix sp.]